MHDVTEQCQKYWSCVFVQTIATSDRLTVNNTAVVRINEMVSNCVVLRTRCAAAYVAGRQTRLRCM